MASLVRRGTFLFEQLSRAVTSKTGHAVCSVRAVQHLAGRQQLSALASFLGTMTSRQLGTVERRHFTVQPLENIPLYSLSPLQESDHTPSGSEPSSLESTPTVLYTVEVATGSVRGAGTPNMATLQLFGSQGDSPLYRIGDDNDNLGGPGFARDSIKRYTFRAHNLGAIRRVQLKKDLHKSSELGSGWFLERVVVTAADISMLVFPCHAWIGEPDDGSGAAEFERNLLPCVQPTPTPDRKPASPISIRSAGVAIPHPDKLKDGKRGVNLRHSGFAGEDAYFYTPGTREMFGMGVADGVYAWRHHGIDSGVFSRTLMDTAQHMVDAGQSDVLRIVQTCNRKVQSEGIYGSSTFCMAVVDRAWARMHTACLGDSGFMVIGVTPEHSKPHVKFRTSQQEHEFGYPFQLGSQPSADRPEDCMLASVRVEKGDIIIMGSDGLWDNLFDREIAAIALRHQAASAAPNPAALARELVSEAYENSRNKRAFTPYSYAASEWFDMVYNGGKPDDIATVAAFIE